MRIQELRARMWAYDRQIGRIGIIRCFEAGCQSQSEMAEFWDVTEEFMIILSVAGFSACGGSQATSSIPPQCDPRGAFSCP